ncbi:MAG: SLC13 family permease [Proteobacteria bacterium]|nr:SLC13 family permease [Pseudomonadota bacterium]MDA0952342.1 SLC13 family permease [Pseudomonadota bacterium]
MPEKSTAVGVALHELDQKITDSNVQIVALIRDGHRMLSAARYVHVRAGDVLMLSASPEGMAKAVDNLDLELVGEKSQAVEALKSEDVVMLEAIVPTGSRIEGHTPSSLRLGSRYDLNLLAVSRQGQPTRGRLRSFRFQAGDILLLQGERDHATSALARLGLLPLAERKIAVSARRRALPAVAIFATAVIAAAIGLAPITITFSLAMLAMVLLGMVNLRELYEAIDWPVLVLLGAMIPVGGALEATGTTVLLANGLLTVMSGAPPLALLAVVLIVTMTLSDIMNNAATAIVIAPIAVGVASALGVATDPFLMAVAVGASCAFLTPIGHQNNTLIMGPGGYRFGDYWRMGLPLEVIIVGLALVLIPWAWPLQPV